MVCQLFFINEYFLSLEYFFQEKEGKWNFLEYESIKQKIQEIHVHRQAEENVIPFLLILLDKITDNGKG